MLLSKIGRMSESKKTNSEQTVATNDLFELTSLFDELNRRYKVVNTPKKEDEDKEQSNENA
jgi:hypothetical protein